ncbi:MAG TPA: efflux RND transporter periplasmic adaptor subunit [Leptolyngbyaceae cyanobacterium]
MEVPIIGKIGKVKRPLPWIMGLITAGILAVAGAAYFVIDSKTSKIDLAKLTVPVQAQNLTVRITANGSVVPIQTVNLSPKTSGRLAKLFVEQGDKVQQGQRVALMENGDLQARYLQAKANLTKAQASLAEVQAGSRPEEIAQAQARLLQAQARLDEARAGKPSDIDQARAQVEAARSRLALAKLRAERYQSLAEQGAVNLDQRDEAMTELRNANAALFEAEQRLQKVRTGSRPEIVQLEAAVAEARVAVQQLQNGRRPEEIAQYKAAVEAARAELQSMQVQLEDTVITAPFSGIVTQKYATEGAFVTPTTSASSTASATSTSIIAIAEGLEILAEVPEVDVGQIKPGQLVEIVANAFPDKVFKGRVKRVAPEAVKEQNVTSFQVRVELLTGQQELRSRMNVDLTFLGEQLSNALVVPNVAIFTQKDGQRGVMVPDLDNKPKFKPVTIGSQIQNQTQILEGLKQDERVFIELPQEFIREKDDQQNED